MKSPRGALLIVLISLSVKVCDLQGPLWFLKLKIHSKSTILQFLKQWNKNQQKKKRRRKKDSLRQNYVYQKPEALIAVYFLLFEAWSESWCGMLVQGQCGQPLNIPICWNIPASRSGHPGTIPVWEKTDNKTFSWVGTRGRTQTSRRLRGMLQRVHVAEVCLPEVIGDGITEEGGLNSHWQVRLGLSIDLCFLKQKS